MLSRRDLTGPGGYQFGRESMAPGNRLQSIERYLTSQAARAMTAYAVPALVM